MNIMKNAELRHPDPSLNSKTIILIAGLSISNIAIFYWHATFALSLTDITAFTATLLAILAASWTVITVTKRVTNNTIYTTVLTALILNCIFWSANPIAIQHLKLNSHSITASIVAFIYFLTCAKLVRSYSTKLSFLIIFSATCIPPTLYIHIYYQKQFSHNELTLFSAENPLENSYHNSLPKASKVQFTRKPDIYLIGLLAASPATVLKKSMGLDNSNISTTLSELGFRHLEQIFSVSATTRNSYDEILGIHHEYVESFAANDRLRGQQFSGNVYSPLFDIFRSNGYTITTLSDDHKFGYNRGPYVDHYLVNTELSICKIKDVIRPEHRFFAFLGVCNLRLSELFPKKRKVGGPVAQLLIETILTSNPPSPGPRLTVAHLKPPIHAPSEFTPASSSTTLTTFFKRYQKADKESANYLREIFKAIKNDDRPFIVIVFGDRGVGILNKTQPDSPLTILVEDRYAVISAIYPFASCKEFITTKTKTTQTLMHELINCLSEKEIFHENKKQTIIHEKTLIDLTELLKNTNNR